MGRTNDSSDAPTGFLADADKWDAVAGRDRTADGRFVYAVRTTGVYCRPSCPSRPALRRNVSFHETGRAAKDAGYRACKRCRPDRVAHRMADPA